MLKTIKPNCPNCSIAKNVSLKYSQVNGLDINFCAKCKNGFTYPIPKNLAKYYHSSYWTTSGFLGNIKDFVYKLFQNRRKIWVYSQIGKGKILEIGCGEGNFQKVLGESFEYKGLEHPLAKIKNKKIIKSDYLKWKNKQSFNAIIFWESLEHVAKPKDYLKKTYELLDKDGLVFIELPRFNCLESKIFKKHWFHLDPPRHLVHLTDAGLQNLLNKIGFKIIAQKSVFAAEYTVWGFTESMLAVFGLKSTDYFKKNNNPFILVLLLPLLMISFIAEIIFYFLKESPIGYIVAKKYE